MLLTGVVTHISPLLKMTMGPTVFIELINSDDNKTEFITLSKGSISKKSILRLNRVYAFSGLKRCLWKRAISVNNSASTSESQAYWYFGDDDSDININICHEFPQHNSSLTAQSGTAQRRSFKLHDMVEPPSSYLRGLFSSTEVIIEGIVCNLNPMGWIEILLRRPYLPLGKGRKINVFIVHYRRSETTDMIRSGLAIRISFVFPIYLWGKLSGFAATLRSHIEIIDQANVSPGVEKSSRGTFLSLTTTNISRNITSWNDNSSSNNDQSGNNNDNNSGNNSNSSSSSGRIRDSPHQKHNNIDITTTAPIPHNSIGDGTPEVPERAVKLRVPPDLKARCHMYAAWRVYVHMRYALCTRPVAFSDNIYESVASSDVSEEVLLAVEGEYRHTAYFTNTITSTNNGTSSSRGDLLRDVSSVRALSLLPSSRSVQEEFVDAKYAELYAVRAGHDSDWLSAKLPKVHSCSDIKSISNGVFKSDIGDRSHQNRNRNKNDTQNKTTSCAASSLPINDSDPDPNLNPDLPNKQQRTGLNSSVAFTSSSGVEESEWSTTVMQLNDAIHNEKSLSACPSRSSADPGSGSGLYVFLSSMVGMEINAEETFAAIRVNDGKGATCMVLVKGCTRKIKAEMDSIRSDERVITRGDTRDGGCAAEVSGADRHGSGSGSDGVESSSTIRSHSNYNNSSSSSNDGGDGSSWGHRNCLHVLLIVDKAHLLLQSNPFAGQRGDSGGINGRDGYSIVGIGGSEGPSVSIDASKRIAGFIESHISGRMEDESGGDRSVSSIGFKRSTIIRCSNTKNSSSSSMYRDVSDNSDMKVITVRDLLKCGRDALGKFNGQNIPAISGIVVYKGLLAQENNPAPSSASSGAQEGYQSFCRKQEEDYRRNVHGVKAVQRKCKVVLRDENYGDIVTLYMSVPAAVCAIVGLKVIIFDSTIHVAASLRNLYLKDSKNTSIGVVGVPSFLEMESLGLRSRTSPRASEPDTNQAYINPSPRCTVSHLHENRLYNRALWTVQGKSTFVKKVCVKLKCYVCHSEVKDGPPGFLCWNCGSRCTLRPCWNATVLFDDGTGECLVHAEGISAVSLLSRSGGAPFSSDLKDRVEEGCLRYGAVRYDSYFSHWHRMDALNNTTQEDGAAFTWDTDVPHSSILPPTFVIPPKSSSSSYLKIPETNSVVTDNFYNILGPAHKIEKELETYFDTEQSGRLFILQVKIIPAKTDAKKTEEMQSDSKNPHSDKKRNNNSNNDGDEFDGEVEIISAALAEKERQNLALQNLLKNAKRDVDVSSCDPNLTARNIKVQENNDLRPYSVSFLTLPTLCLSGLTLEAVSVTPMGSREVAHEAWRGLQLLQSRVGLN